MMPMKAATAKFMSSHLEEQAGEHSPFGAYKLYRIRFA
jgi:hypothetical protein